MLSGSGDLVGDALHRIINDVIGTRRDFSDHALHETVDQRPDKAAHLVVGKVLNSQTYGVERVVHVVHVVGLRGHARAAILGHLVICKAHSGLPKDSMWMVWQLSP
ncbi:hypothetical protein KL953_34210 [Mycolicibacterium goodii]|uniref:hypothetical protein n=1 Tax=Mycolicibacterium goodii TaxID=134601 RepID=UPI001BDD635A|nr:hypothetical protein [Mycolicibacterium goodii]MBU8813920.1 hypothetical protein [Mycolicibacterium goodii]